MRLTFSFLTLIALGCESNIDGEAGEKANGPGASEPMAPAESGDDEAAPDANGGSHPHSRCGVQVDHIPVTVVQGRLLGRVSLPAAATDVFHSIGAIGDCRIQLV